MFNTAKKTIEEAEKIYVVGHINPDGDSIGSAFAIRRALEIMGKQVKVIMTKCADNYRFLPNIDAAVDKVVEDSYDLLVAVDSSDITRLDISQEDIKKAKKILMIDHHKITSPYGDVNIILDNEPATSQVVYEFLDAIGFELDTEVAIYLYTGIMTDTGSFNYSSTTPRTFEIVSKLISHNIDFTDICKRLNDTVKEGKLRLIGKTIDRMEVYFDGKVRLSYIDYETISNLGLDEEDAEGMTNYLRMVEGTEVAIYIRGKSNGDLKVSMRSSGNFDASKVAIVFGGGGHARASGYTMRTKDYEREKRELLKVIEEML